MNTNNFGIAIGRLTADPVFFANSNGSAKVKFTIAARDNFKSKDTNGAQVVKSQFIPLEAYIANPQGRQIYTMLKKGDKVSVSYSVRTNNYADKNGEMHYGIILFVESIQFEESKTQAAARRAAQAQAPAYATATQAPVYNGASYSAMPQAPVYDTATTQAPSAYEQNLVDLGVDLDGEDDGYPY